MIATGTPPEPGAGRTRSAVEQAQNAGRAIRDLIEVAASGGDPPCGTRPACTGPSTSWPCSTIGCRRHCSS